MSEQLKNLDGRNSNSKFQLNAVRNIIREKNNEISLLKDELISVEAFKNEKNKKEGEIKYLAHNLGNIKEELEKKTKRLRELEKSNTEYKLKSDEYYIENQLIKKDNPQRNYIELLNQKMKIIKKYKDENTRLRAELVKYDKNFDFAASFKNDSISLETQHNVNNINNADKSIRSSRISSGKRNERIEIESKSKNDDIKNVNNEEGLEQKVQMRTIKDSPIRIIDENNNINNKICESAIYAMDLSQEGNAIKNIHENKLDVENDKELNEKKYQQENQDEPKEKDFEIYNQDIINNNEEMNIETQNNKATVIKIEEDDISQLKMEIEDPEFHENNNNIIKEFNSIDDNKEDENKNIMIDDITSTSLICQKEIAIASHKNKNEENLNVEHQAEKLENESKYNYKDQKINYQADESLIHNFKEKDNRENNILEGNMNLQKSLDIKEEAEEEIEINQKEKSEIQENNQLLVQEEEIQATEESNNQSNKNISKNEDVEIHETGNPLHKEILQNDITQNNLFQQIKDESNLVHVNQSNGINDGAEYDEISQNPMMKIEKNKPEEENDNANYQSSSQQMSQDSKNMIDE